MLYKVVWTFDSGLNVTVWPLKRKLLSNYFLWYCLLSYTIQADRTFEYAGLKKSYRATIQITALEQYFPAVLFYYAVQDGSSVWVYG